MISKWLFSGALLFEIGSWVAFHQQLSVAQATTLYLGAHLLSSAMLSAGIWLLLPRRYKFPLPWSPLFVFSLAFFVPGLGAIGVAVSLFPALYLPRRKQEQNWDSRGVPDLPFRPQERSKALMFNDGGLQDVLRNAPDTEKRLTALFATRRMPAREAIPILKLALRDPADDVRLLAYSMLDKQESEINLRIETTLRQLSAAEGVHQAALHDALARWYWELAYLGLAQGSVLEHVLEQAREHVEQALSAAGNPYAHVLAGRIALEQTRLDAAKMHFNQAETVGVGVQTLAPFRAEIAFIEGSYEDVSQQLARLTEDVLQRPPFAALAKYWL
ncbi:protein PelE [Pseudomonas sp. MT-1]|uniref:HEAT repeat domain-containing protein n=1 Tax=Stutzerimonas stutzeri TaxID=316 RepID=UPI000535EDD5|nr:HEAT repeat domain-containing protein [Stutzerimonas stutzeri]MCQ4281855.1 HEAT repeat domain-containing protein [Stutzerimonas stutzeri]BAP77896.1 protein PelE [Pseudomonas sp. MT-1]